MISNINLFSSHYKLISMGVLLRLLLFCEVLCLIVSQTIISDKQGNRVIGAGNVWEGNKNNITG